MRTLVIYKSKYGTSKKYSNCIREELRADMLDLKRINRDILRKYDNIIFGSGLYAERMNGLKDFLVFYDAINDKNIYIFTVGLTNPFNKTNIEYMDNIIKKDVKEEDFNNIKTFHYLGAMDYKKLNLFNKLMIRIFVVMMKKNNKLSEEDKKMINSYTSAIDLTKKEYITELVQNVKKK